MVRRVGCGRHRQRRRWCRDPPPPTREEGGGAGGSWLRLQQPPGRTYGDDRGPGCGGRPAAAGAPAVPQHPPPDRLQVGPPAAPERTGRTDLVARVGRLATAAGAGGRRSLCLQWVPGHAGICGNEAADRLANDAASADQTAVPIDLASARGRRPPGQRCGVCRSDRRTDRPGQRTRCRPTAWPTMRRLPIRPPYRSTWPAHEMPCRPTTRGRAAADARAKEAHPCPAPTPGHDDLP